jgi:hypothetical protein
MKSFMILILLIFSIILIPSAFSQEEIMTVTTDKEAYVYGEDVTISGTGYPPEDLVDLSISENSVYTQAGVDSEGNFSKMFGSHNFSVNGTYTIVVISTVYGVSLAQTTFQYGDIPEPIIEPTNPLTIQSDKSIYYIGDPIIINGTVTNIDWSADTAITYDISYADEIVQTRSGITLQDDGTFNFLIDTNTWNDVGSHIITVTIQNFTADVSVYYENTPDMTNEALYEMGMTQYDMIEDIEDELVAQNETLVAQNETLESIQSSIDTILNILRGLLAGTDNS